MAISAVVSVSKLDVNRMLPGGSGVDGVRGGTESKEWVTVWSLWMGWHELDGTGIMMLAGWWPVSGPDEGLDSDLKAT